MARTINVLNQVAKSEGIDPNRLKAIFALERIVARMESEPKLSSSLVYKGGFVLHKTIETNRLTRDVDAFANNLSPEEATRRIIEALGKDIGDDIYFMDAQVSPIETPGDYGGVSISTAFSIGEVNVDTAKIRKLSRVHFDVAFDSYLPEKLDRREMPVILDRKGMAVSWSILPIEYIFAEKLQTLVVRADANSRGKDVYDMWLISNRIENTDELMRAIVSVFADRSTDLPSSFADFLSNLDLRRLRASWGAILFAEADISFDEAVTGLVGFFKRLSAEAR